MTWAETLMASLDERARVLETDLGLVQVAREGHGPRVLAIHGGPGGFDQALSWCRHLQDGGCELIAPSRPGYLRTPLASGRSPERQADLYAAVLDELEIERVTVFAFSSGGPSAVHFAARYPERTTALLLDSAILLPFEVPIGRLRQATFESRLIVWLTYQLATRMPRAMTAWMISGVSRGLSKDQKKAQTEWITSDPDRLRRVQEQWISIAPRKYRNPGWTNDQANESRLAPLPFAAVAAPTLIAHGANEAIVPIEHARRAASEIPNADLVVVDEGHHLLSLSRNYGSVAARQLELMQGAADRPG